MNTEIVLVLDKSGSMGTLYNDTLGSVNAFLDEQKAQEGEASLTLVLFNTEIQTLLESCPIKDAPILAEKNYRVGGATALLDAMGVTIDRLGARLAALPEDKRPERIVFVTITDGEENSSHRFTLEQIRDKVKHQTEVYQWTFLFLGVGIDAFADAQNLGLNAATAAASVGHDSMSYSAGMRAASQAISSVRSVGHVVGTYTSLVEDQIKKGPRTVA